MAELVFVTRRELTEPRHPELAHYLAQFSLEIPARSRRCRAGSEVIWNESELLSATRALEFRVTAFSCARRMTLMAAKRAANDDLEIRGHGRSGVHQIFRRS
jgi:hypothetical protein